MISKKPIKNNFVNGKFKLKFILPIISIALLYFIVSATTFCDTGFSWTIFTNFKFWTSYFISLGYGLFILFIAIFYKKSKCKELPLIQNDKFELYQLNEIILSINLIDLFKNHLKKINKNRKLAIYKKYLINKKEKCKNQEEIDKYDKLIEETKKETFDIETKNIKIKILTSNIIFLDCYTSNEFKSFFYNGKENLGKYIMPTIIFGAIMTSIIHVVSLTGKKNISMNTILKFLSILWLMSSYLLKGLSYGEYSINNIYHNVLLNRKNEVIYFLKKNNVKLEVKENENNQIVYSLIDNKEIKNG